MAWLPSHQELRDHPKLRRAAGMLGIPRPQMIGHLHCLWWWALSYAPDGDLTAFDDDDIADAADWDNQDGDFVSVLMGCGFGGRAGFMDRDRHLHDWNDYAGRYDQKKSGSDGARGNHVRWHEKRGVIEAGCPFCPDDRGESGATSPDAPHESGGESQSRGEEKRGEEREAISSVASWYDLRADHAPPSFSTEGASCIAALELDYGDDQVASAVATLVADPKKRFQFASHMTKAIRTVLGEPPAKAQPSPLDGTAAAARKRAEDDMAALAERKAEMAAVASLPENERVARLERIRAEREKRNAS